MDGPLFLSRLELRRDPEIAALAAELLPRDENRAIATDHRLVWSAFQGRTERRVLWRRDDHDGRYLALSAEPPPSETALFRIQSKPFEPALAPGDRLAFSLRVNATVSRKTGPGRGKRHDVTMDALHQLPKDARKHERQASAEAAGRAWMQARAEADGFALEAVRLEGYRAARIPRRGGAAASIGVLDLTGLLTVVEQARFLDRLSRGFGRAKAFGCGLMLIRRAP